MTRVPVATCCRCNTDIIMTVLEDRDTWEHPDALATSTFIGDVESQWHWRCYVEVFDGAQRRLM